MIFQNLMSLRKLRCDIPSGPPNDAFAHWTHIQLFWRVSERLQQVCKKCHTHILSTFVVSFIYNIRIVVVIFYNILRLPYSSSPAIVYQMHSRYQTCNDMSKDRNREMGGKWTWIEQHEIQKTHSIFITILELAHLDLKLQNEFHVCWGLLSLVSKLAKICFQNIIL